jgi:3-hydroxyacyl-CoA dehydrogenase
MNLGYGKTATSPIIAKKQAMLRPNDRFVINRDRILGEAIKAIDDPAGQVAFERPALKLPGRPVFEEMIKWLETSRDKGMFMQHDVNVGTEMALVATDATRERINSMLDAGSPVRN